jgi:glycine betaine/proline transport system substrate-binding protein
MLIKMRTQAAACTLALLMAVGGAAQAQSSDPIKLTLHDSTGQLITTKLMGEALKRSGFNVEYVQADYFAQFTGLKSGDLHVAMEIWETTGREAMDEATATGQVVNMGETGMQAIEEWWFPTYMKEKCPGLPDWKALKGCAELFSTPETAPKGRYLSGPVTWGGHDEERSDALDLDFEVTHAGSDAAMFAELDSAVQRKAPIMLWVWTPHWAPAKYDGEWIEFPKFEPECYSDPSWGTNPDKAYDCGKPRGPIWKVAWAGLEGKWPKAHKAVMNFNISNDEASTMVGKVDLENMELDAVVNEWIDANESRWRAWFE